MTQLARDLVLYRKLWCELTGSNQAPQLELSGPEHTLPSAYHVSAFASASIALANAAAAALHAARSCTATRRVFVDRVHAAAAFQCERLLAAQGWKLPEAWDPLAGDYPTRDGWMRIHTNYSHHRDAVLRVLGVPAERAAIALAVARADGEALEQAIVGANGCAALMRSPAEWAEHAQGQALAREPLFAIDAADGGGAPELGAAPAAAPLAGVRVLDLTRVIAGPIATRFLAAQGADVLRIDPPGFAEVPLLVCEVTAGKRRAALDLRREPDRTRFEQLVRGAHVIVHGYRSNALERLGYDQGALRSLNPALTIVCHDAYGWTGPWAARRGFDSLVQMSCGIAWRGREAKGGDKPRPLPVQALDHATGYMLAGAVCHALSARIATGKVHAVRLALARSARCLIELGSDADITAPRLAETELEAFRERADTAFGPVLRVRTPGRIEGLDPVALRAAGPVGVDPAAW